MRGLWAKATDLAKRFESYKFTDETREVARLTAIWSCVGAVGGSCCSFYKGFFSEGISEELRLKLEARYEARYYEALQVSQRQMEEQKPKANENKPVMLE